MPQRLTYSPHQALATEVAQLQDDLREFKSRQLTSAKSGVLGYFSQSSNTWDMTNTVGTDADTTTILKTYKVTFTHDSSQPAPFARPASLIYANGTASGNQLTPVHRNWTDGTRSATVQYGGTTVSNGIYTATFLVTTLKQVTIYLKGFANASCPGTIAVTVV